MCFALFSPSDRLRLLTLCCQQLVPLAASGRLRAVLQPSRNSGRMLQSVADAHAQATQTTLLAGTRLKQAAQTGDFIAAESATAALAVSLLHIGVSAAENLVTSTAQEAERALLVAAGCSSVRDGGEAQPSGAVAVAAGPHAVPGLASLLPPPLLSPASAAPEELLVQASRLGAQVLEKASVVAAGPLLQTLGQHLETLRRAEEAETSLPDSLLRRRSSPAYRQPGSPSLATLAPREAEGEEEGTGDELPVPDASSDDE